MDTDDLVSFPSTDAEYAAWVSRHPNGYVINAPKSKTSATPPLVWHRADCGNIQPDDSITYVEGDYIKACSLNPGPLAVWAKTRPQSMAYCKNCRAKWMKEQS